MPTRRSFLATNPPEGSLNPSRRDEDDTVAETLEKKPSFPAQLGLGNGRVIGCVLGFRALNSETVLRGLALGFRPLDCEGWDEEAAGLIKIQDMTIKSLFNTVIIQTRRVLIV